MLIKESGIYKILNIITYDFYVGSAVYIAGRWRRHHRELCRNIHRNEHLQRAWNKYGEANFEFSVLELCEKELLLVREQWYFDNDHPSYNILPIAGSCLGYKHSDEARANMSEAQKGHVVTETTRAKLIEAWKTRAPMSDETRTEMSRAHRGKHHADKTLAKMSEAQKGHLVSEAVRTRVSASQMGNTNFLGRKHTAKTLSKMSESHKKSWALRRESKLIEQAYIALLY